MLCGNGVVDSGEQCDGNCAGCVAPRGFMCPGANRSVHAPFTPAPGETCTELAPARLWDPSLYNVNISLPAAGLYTSSTCAQFPVPALYTMHDCALTPVDACQALDPPPCPEGVCFAKPGSHHCQCREGMFQLRADGTECTDFGVEMHVTAVDASLFVNQSLVDACASDTLQALRPGGFLTTDAVDAIERSYQVATRTDATRTWKLSFRIPLMWIDVDLVSLSYADLVPVVSDAVTSCGMVYTALSFNDATYDNTAAESTGMEIVSYEWVAGDPLGLGWLIQVSMFLFLYVYLGFTTVSLIYFVSASKVAVYKLFIARDSLCLL